MGNKTSSSSAGGGGAPSGDTDGSRRRPWRRSSSLQASHRQSSRRPSETMIWSGWLRKAGKVNKSWRERYISLERSELLYGKAPGQPPRGCIHITPAVSICELSHFSDGDEAARRHLPFLLLTPERTWMFACSSEEQKEDFFSAILSQCQLKEGSVVEEGWLAKQSDTTRRWKRLYAVYVSTGHMLFFEDTKMMSLKTKIVIPSYSDVVDHSQLPTRQRSWTSKGSTPDVMEKRLSLVSEKHTVLLQFESAVSTQRWKALLRSIIFDHDIEGTAFRKNDAYERERQRLGRRKKAIDIRKHLKKAKADHPTKAHHDIRVNRQSVAPEERQTLSSEDMTAGVGHFLSDDEDSWSLNKPVRRLSKAQEFSGPVRLDESQSTSVLSGSQNSRKGRGETYNETLAGWQYDATNSEQSSLSLVVPNNRSLEGKRKTSARPTSKADGRDGTAGQENTTQGALGAEHTDSLQWSTPQRSHPMEDEEKTGGLQRRSRSRKRERKTYREKRPRPRGGDYSSVRSGHCKVPTEEVSPKAARKPAPPPYPPPPDLFQSTEWSDEAGCSVKSPSPHRHSPSSAESGNRRTRNAREDRTSHIKPSRPRLPSAGRNEKPPRVPMAALVESTHRQLEQDFLALKTKMSAEGRRSKKLAKQIKACQQAINCLATLIPEYEHRETDEVFFGDWYTMEKRGGAKVRHWIHQSERAAHRPPPSPLFDD